MQDSVSVIIPTFNRKHCISRALESVLNQSYKHIKEIIVIDDGSTDGTKKFLENNFQKIKIISQDNRGVSAARNQGIKESTGEWLAFLDSDDFWAQKKIEEQMSALVKNHNKYLICHTDEIWIRNGIRVNPMKKHKKFGGPIFEKCLELCLISPSSVIIHRSVFSEVGFFDESLPVCEDYDLWLRITAQLPVLFIPKQLLTKFGGHDDQLSQSTFGFDRYRAKALIKIIESDTLTSLQKIRTKEVLIKKLRIYINGALKRGNIVDAKKYEIILQKYK